MRGRPTTRNASFVTWTAHSDSSISNTRYQNHAYKQFIQFIRVGKFPAKCTDTSKVPPGQCKSQRVTGTGHEARREHQGF